jgi:hypothetical protein
MEPSTAAGATVTVGAGAIVIGAGATVTVGIGATVTGAGRVTGTIPSTPSAVLVRRRRPSLPLRIADASLRRPRPRRLRIADAKAPRRDLAAHRFAPSGDRPEAKISMARTAPCHLATMRHGTARKPPRLVLATFVMTGAPTARHTPDGAAGSRRVFPAYIGRAAEFSGLRVPRIRMCQGGAFALPHRFDRVHNVRTGVTDRR